VSILGQPNKKVRGPVVCGLSSKMQLWMASMIGMPNLRREIGGSDGGADGSLRCWRKPFSWANGGSASSMPVGGGNGANGQKETESIDCGFRGKNHFAFFLATIERGLCPIFEAVLEENGKAFSPKCFFGLDEGDFKSEFEDGAFPKWFVFWRARDTLKNGSILGARRRERTSKIEKTKR
jgi:hypothetical protein